MYTNNNKYYKAITVVPGTRYQVPVHELLTAGYCDTATVVNKNKKEICERMNNIFVEPGMWRSKLSNVDMLRTHTWR